MFVIYACNIYREFIKDFRATKKIGVFLENLPYPGIGKAETGEHFAGIILVFFFHTREIKMANRRGNKMTEHILFTIFTKKTSSLFPTQTKRKRNRALLEALVPHVTSLRRRFALFSISFVIYCPFLTIKEQYQKIEYFIDVSCGKKAENRNADMFVTNVLHIPRQIAFPR